MNKILTGFLGLFAVVGLVGGIAYAVFNSQVGISGAVLGTASPDLQICSDPNTCTSGIIPYPGSPTFGILIPGQSDWGEFYLKNNSSVPSMTFDLTGQLTHAEGDWNLLKNAIEGRVCLYVPTSGAHCDEAHTTGWLSLADWNAAPVDLPGDPLATTDGTVHYAVEVRLPEDSGNNLAGKEITNVSFVITGTQHVETEL